MSKRLLISLLIVGLLGFTVVKVGALWSQTSPAVPVINTRPQLESFSEKAWREELGPQQEALYERLNLRLEQNRNDFEASLLQGLLLFQTGRINAAVDELQQLVERAPKFQLAHLILGDLLLARFDQVAAIGESAVLRQIGTKEEQRIELLRQEAQARLRGYLTLVSGVEVPKALLSLSRETEYALIVDKSKNRLYIYRNVGPGLPPELVDDYYIVLGKKTGDKYREGDLRTPNGVYFVTSYLPDEKLPPLYGSGAFPVNYPNEFDRRLQKTGNGIWLHGTDKGFYSRPPLDSEGCVVLTNEEFERIEQYVEIGRTPVIISEQVEWIDSREWLDRNIEIQASLEQWRQYWEAAEIDKYLQMYAQDFWAKGHDINSWKKSKQRILTAKKFQKIDLKDISLLGYPRVADGRQIIVANFFQQYRSNNYNGDMRKRLYMVKDRGRWQVLYEGHQ